MQEILSKIEGLLKPILEGTDMFLVNMKVKPTNNIKVFLDSDSGLSIEKSATVNRKLYAAIEAIGLFPDGDFSLEVSSPGVDEPLGQTRQYKKNIGRKVLVSTIEDKDETGILKQVDEDKIVLEQKLPKKNETRLLEIPFSNIKKTVVQINFN
jgi:ribosome maturation factor RimP